MPFAIPPGFKFACVALSARVNHAELQEPLDLGDGRWASFDLPFELPPHWREWLGTVQSNRFTNSNLFLFALAASDQPEILNTEDKQLRAGAFQLFLGTLMHETLEQEAGMIISGANREGQLEPRTISTLEHHYRARGAVPRAVSRNWLEAAGAIAAGLKSVYGIPEFARLRKGIEAWRHGFMSFYGDERLHQFVRCAEAAVMPEIGRTQRQFRHRAQMFAGNSAEAADLLDELYELRSAAEHMNDFADALSDHPTDQRDHIGSLRAYQAEVLASGICARILTNPVLRQQFQDDDSILVFWQRSWQDQTAAWGPPIDLFAVERDRFRLP